VSEAWREARRATDPPQQARNSALNHAVNDRRAIVLYRLLGEGQEQVGQSLTVDLGQITTPAKQGWGCLPP
jgi:hypothetical protein